MKMIFLSYRKISYAIISTFFIIINILLFYSIIRLPELKESSITALSSTVKSYRTLYADTDGNGKKDTIDISIDEGKKEYLLEITNDNHKKFSLPYGSKYKTVGPYLTWWPLLITIADINTDNIPEIITQASKSANSLPLYIFRWNGKTYETVFAGTYNGIYISDIGDDMIPEITAEDGSVGKKLLTFSWLGNSYKKADITLKTGLKGYDKIENVIKYMSNPFGQKNSYGDIINSSFTKEWIQNSKNMDYIKTFSSNIVSMQLQDYIGQSLMTDKKDKVSELWKIRYMIFRRYDSQLKVENCIAEIETKIEDSKTGDFKINSIKFSKE
ncbi:MAG: hypothetical protein QME45_06430 [Clostridiales bacterium]|nr:hypothetical protein [Clostridiales bacterium]